MRTAAVCMLLLSLSACAGRSVDETLIPELTTTTNPGRSSDSPEPTPIESTTTPQPAESTSTNPAATEPTASDDAREPVVHVLGTYELLAADSTTLRAAADLFDSDLATVATIGCVRGTTGCAEAGVAALAAGGVDLVNMATPHGDDGGIDALDELTSDLLENGIRPIGFGRSRQAAVAPEIVTARDVSIAVHAISIVEDDGPTSHATDTTAGIAGPDSVDLLVDAIVESLLAGHQVVVLVSWGTPEGRAPDAAQLEFARRLIETGAAAVVGNGPRLQRFELIEDTAVAHSLGPAATELDDPLLLDSAVARLSFSSAEPTCLLPATASPSGPILDDRSTQPCR